MCRFSPFQFWAWATELTAQLILLSVAKTDFEIDFSERRQNAWKTCRQDYQPRTWTYLYYFKTRENISATVLKKVFMTCKLREKMIFSFMLLKSIEPFLTSAMHVIWNFLAAYSDALQASFFDVFLRTRNAVTLFASCGWLGLHCSNCKVW